MKTKIMKSTMVLFAATMILFGFMKRANSQDLSALPFLSEKSLPIKMISHENLSDGALDAIKKIQAPFGLRINEPVHDEDLKNLIGLTSLKQLTLMNCSNITDVGLQYLSELKNLDYLSLSFSFRITDAGLKHLTKLSELQNFYLLFFSKISDEGIAFLKDLPKLRVLVLEDCKLTSAAILPISEMKKLTILYLSCSETFNFTEKDIQQIGTAPELRVLRLNNCAEITSEILEKHLPLNKMTCLMLSNCKKISETDVEKLKAAWPKCIILIR